MEKRPHSVQAKAAEKEDNWVQFMETAIKGTEERGDRAKTDIMLSKENPPAFGSIL